MKNTLLFCLILNLVACQTTPKPLDDLSQDVDGQFVRLVHHDPVVAQKFKSQELKAASSAALRRVETIQKGDLIRLTCQRFKEIEGVHQVTASGGLNLPYLGDIYVAGLIRQQSQRKVIDRLVELAWLDNNLLELNISIIEQAAISVSVFGAVFNPGRTVINAKPAIKPVQQIRQETGAYAGARNLLQAISNAGGVRPDADIKNILLIRDSKPYLFDLQPIIKGGVLPNLPDLNAGDELYVPSIGQEQRSLVTPSDITPPGLRIFASNLTAPALSNAQSAVGNDSSRLPYGASLIDAAISSNCVGGTHMANASRSILLITKNHGSNQQIVVNRTINQLLENSSNVMVNPYIMPNDGVACYDSKFTNFRDVARGLGDLISPLILGKLL